MHTSENKKSAVDLVVDRITNEIISGELQPGDRLPTEPELSAKYGVGRNSVREAIKQLQAFGILYIRRADGTFVTESYQQPMLDPMLYSLILKKRDWNDFVQLRAVIDIGTLQVALENPEVGEIVPQLLEMVEKIGKEMRKKEPDVDRILEMDLAFHRSIALTIHNPQIDTVTSYVARLTVPSRRETVRKWLDSNQIEEFLELHRQIADVIEKRDTARITQAVMEHYVFWK
ncbi:MAG: GntR family transcriptional regulator [Clostridium sp.]|nr:GntR family transcriptional regulator [Clostridiaceae bacterium]MDY5483210.1 GntR family transcriptional regulator [Clostridium sp.]